MEIQDNEDEYEGAEESNHNCLLGFMFGNIDSAGDIEIDYLDKEAKEHLGALADKLGLSFTDDINLSVTSTHIVTEHEDYDDKAEDAVDYQDIAEQYRGSEEEEENYLFSNLVSEISVFDDENYDAEEESNENSTTQVCEADNTVVLSESLQGEIVNAASETEEFKHYILEEPVDNHNLTPFPILYSQDGEEILRFSEIFGMHKAYKKSEMRGSRYSVAKDKCIVVEEDEETFLRGLCQGFSWKCQTHINDDNLLTKDCKSDEETLKFVQHAGTEDSQVSENRGETCFCDEPMKEDIAIDPFPEKVTSLSPELYLLELQHWEDGIIWDNDYPKLSDRFAETTEIFGPDSGALGIGKLESNIEEKNIYNELQMETDETDNITFQPSYPVSVEPFGSRKFSGSISSERKYHPQLLRLESRLETGSDGRKDNSTTEEMGQRDAIRSYNKVTPLNRDLLEGSWLDNVIWEPYQSMTKPKLILDLQDAQMLFEILDDKDGKHLKCHAGAMIITRSMKFTHGDLVEMSGHGALVGESFNIANDKFYTNKKSSQQQKSHSKKRTAHGVCIAPKTPYSNAIVKKKAAVSRVRSTVAGTDAELRRLSMEAAREVLLKFNIPKEQIEKLSRRHRIAMIRKLSSEQAAAGVKVDPTTISKYAHGQRKCHKIQDRQVQSLAAVNGEEKESGIEATSDPDSFAGDLENLLDAEEGEGDERNYESKHDNTNSVKGLKRKRHPFQAQAEEEFEDEAAEAAELCRMLMDDDEAERKKEKIQMGGKELKQAPGSHGFESVERVEKTNAGFKQDTPVVQPQFTAKDDFNIDMEDERFPNRKSFSTKLKAKKKNDIEHLSFLKKVKIIGEGTNTLKEKQSARDSFVCGACGQLGHMRTNKKCPKYGEDPEARPESRDTEKASVKLDSLDKSAVLQQKPLLKQIAPKSVAKTHLVETPEEEKSSSKAKILKVKCSSTDKLLDKATPATSQVSDMPITSDTDTTIRPTTKVNKIIFVKKTRPEDTLVKQHKPSIVIKPPVETDRDQPCKKLIIKRPKEHIDNDQISQEKSTSFEDYREQESSIQFAEGSGRRNRENNLIWEKEQKRIVAERKRFQYDQEIKLEEQERVEEIRRTRIDRRIPGRERTAKRQSPFESVRYGSEHAPPTKRLRGGGGEVGLANILENIVEILKEKIEISYLFLKPVLRKEASDYHSIVKRPMDLSTIKEKVRNLEYKSHKDFRHDMWQIMYNAHLYNDKRNPGIPPLADQLLELCDYLLIENYARLSNAEAGIEIG